MEPKTKNTTILLAVLPFQILSEDPKAETFCSGLLIDLITDLSRYRSLQIISYESVKELSVSDEDNYALANVPLDYIVKGMVRLQNENLVLNIQLLHADNNRLVWAEKFQGHLSEIFHIQEEITEKIVASLQHFVDMDLFTETRKKNITHLNAYECWIRGFHEIKEGTLEADERARKYFQQAIEIDPHYARAYTGMSLTYFNEWSCQLWSRWELSQKGAFEWAQKAVELDEMDHISLAILGRLLLFKEDYTSGEHYLRKSLRLNTNDAESIFLIAYGFVYLGYVEEACQLYQRGLEINPSIGDSHISTGSFINFEAGKFEKAVELGEKLPENKGWVDFPAFLAAAYFRMGNMPKMEEMWQRFLISFSEKINNGQPTDSGTALQWMKDINPYRTTTQLEPFWEYMENHTESSKTPTTVKPASYQNKFTLNGDLWTLSYQNKVVQSKGLKGFKDIAKLLSMPYSSFHCTELMGINSTEKGVEVIDHKAKAAYQKRIMEIQQELDEAETTQNSEYAYQLQEEYDQLINHLSQATGLSGKSRKASDSIEKARTAVTWRIRSATKKIGEIHPELGNHLKVSIKTGLFCQYSPENQVEWEV